MSFLIDDDDVILKYNQIWKKNKKLLGVELDSQPIYEGNYIKTKVKTFENVVTTVFSNDEIPKKTKHSCIATIFIDSVMIL